jgi:hypothetical protein
MIDESLLVFIAVPSAGVVKDGALTQEFLKDLAELHIKHPHYTFISPMVQDYALLPYMTVDATWEDWGHHCRKIIERVDAVWVLMYNGWETSIGVQGEINHAYRHGITVEYKKVIE